MSEAPPADRLVPLWQQAAALLIGPVAAVALDARQWLELPAESRSLETFLLAGATAPYVWWLLAAPVALLIGAWQSRRVLASPSADSSASERTPTGSLTCFAFCFAAGFATTAGFGWSVRDLPPLYHDEYSYLFQAWTFLAGRVSYPPPELGTSFDQMHVLNEPVFASRFFPGTGAWLAPFVAIGLPVAGWWTLHGLIAGLTSLVGRRFSTLAGYVAGLSIAAAPGMVALSNLILSPSPTMLGMTLFLWAYFQIFERRSWWWPVLAGLAIGYAFLTRPLTAAGLGFPFAIFSIVRLWHWPIERYRVKFALLVGSFAICAIGLGVFNRAITGDFLTSPYGLYTAEYTPSHVYGFYNKDRGAANRGPKTLTAYDDWAENLTIDRAAYLVARRCWGLIQWSGGVVPVAALGLLALLQLPRMGDRGLLLALAVVGLIAAYAPFGFAGLLGWVYLAEAMPPFVLLLAMATSRLVDDWTRRRRRIVGYWWLALPAIAIASNFATTLPTLFDSGSELVFPRRRAAEQDRLERQAAALGPILVIVDADPRDAVHATLVHNRPTLDGPVVRAWQRGDETERLMAMFPERAVYLYRYRGDGQPAQWFRIRQPVPTP